MQKNLISTALSDALLGLWSPHFTHCANMSSRGHKPVFTDASAGMRAAVGHLQHCRDTVVRGALIETVHPGQAPQ